MRRASTAVGAAVLLGSLWLEWYRVVLPEPPRGSLPVTTFIVYGEEGDIASAWTVFAGVDVLLAVLAAALLVVAARPVTPWLPRVLAGVAGALVVFRMIAPPFELLEPAIGAFVALAAAIAVAGWPERVRGLSPAQLTAGLGGGALLLALGLPWFDAAPPSGWTAYAPLEPEGDGWYAALEGLVAVLAVPALLVPVRPGMARLARATGWLALFLILGRIVSAPNGWSFAPGAFVAFAAAALAWAGALLAAREEPREVS